jgi:mannose-1-phosphate guanylyltransferase
MAGGVGSRFWPLSRASKPKQFLDILGVGKSLIQQTFSRFESIIPIENIYIVSNSEYAEEIARQLPKMKIENILLEPFRRNTAPCIAYASYRILKDDPDARMVIAPSDHLIMEEQVFRNVVMEGLEFVGENDSLLTIGIKPSRPETGYGYIQVDSNHINITGKPTIRKV